MVPMLLPSLLYTVAPTISLARQSPCAFTSVPAGAWAPVGSVAELFAEAFADMLDDAFAESFVAGALADF